MNIATLLLLGFANANTLFNLQYLKQQPKAQDSGLIEMDLDIRQNRRAYKSDAHTMLMNLHEDEYHHFGSDEDGDTRHDYIEKNLYDFYDIQLYAVIYVGSNK